jgi:hypothetical protein
LTLSSSRNLSTVFQAVTLLGLNSPKVSPSTAWARPLDQPCPPGVGSNGPPPRGGRRSSLTFRALISAEVRCSTTDKRRGEPDPPMSFLPSRGCHSLLDGAARRGASSRGLEPGADGEPPVGPALRSLDRGRPETLRRELLPSWGSCTSSRQAGCRCSNRPLVPSNPKIVPEHRIVKAFEIRGVFL